jgi:hypothetical protein
MEGENGKINVKRNKVRIYQSFLNLEYESNSTFMIITETVDFIPIRTYYYKIPESFKSNNCVKELDELPTPYCPN